MSTSNKNDTSKSNDDVCDVNNMLNNMSTADKVAAVCGTFFRSIYFFVFNENMFVCRHTKKNDTWYCFNSRHTGLFFMETV